MSNREEVPTPRLGQVLALAALGVVFSSSAGARVEVEKILEWGPTAPLAFSVSAVRLDDGVVAIEYVTHGPEVALAIGLFGGGADQPRVVDDQTNPPGSAVPCLQLFLGGLSQGRPFFGCHTGAEAGANGIYVWEDDTWTPLINEAGGVPGCSGPLRFWGFGLDASDFHNGKALIQAGALEYPNNCFAFFLGGPTGVTRVGHGALPYPAEFGLPYMGGPGAALGEEGLAFQWLFFASEEGGVEWGIFVDRGQGLETWAGTVPSMPRLEGPTASFGERMRWMQGGLAFSFDGSVGEEIFLADGTTVVPIVDTGTIAPDTGAPFRGLSKWDAAGGVVVFETSSEGFPLHGFYVWEAGEISLLAKAGMVLPGDTIPIAWLGDFVASEDFVFFTATFEDGSRRLFARDSRRLIEIQRSVATPPATTAPSIFLYDRGADGRQVVYETFEGGNQVIYLATVPEALPPLSPIALSALVASLALLGRKAAALA